MQFKVHIVIDDEQSETVTEDIFTIEKLADGDDLLQSLRLRGRGGMDG